MKINAFDQARAGMAAATGMLDRAAASVASLASPTAPAARGDSVQISAAAQGASAGADGGGGLEDALIDQRMAKYAFVASLRVAQTADEMSAELSTLIRRK